MSKIRKRRAASAPGGSSSRIMNMIFQIAREEGADPHAMLATATVESGLNPRALGDGGTSYGLFQHHVGGAGGASHESARRFYDPETSIRERARQFARLGIRGGKGAAALQRPADPSGYAAKVDRELSRIRSGKGPSGGSLNAPITTGGVTGGLGDTTSSPQIGSKEFGRNMLLDMLYEDDNDDDFMKSLLAPRAESVRDEPASDHAEHVELGAGQKPISGGYKRLQRIGQNRFGLQNDPGTAQTTGGRHAPGSHHYAGRAVDFGDARNSPEQLKSFAAFMRKKYGQNIKELYYGKLGWHIRNGKVGKGTPVGGHDDHLHIAM